MARCKAAPYDGAAPYVFVSYSHRDKELVFPVIERLSSDGFRVWYDEGIDPGSEWISNIGDHLSSSAAVISFLSNNSATSQNCREEIMFARDARIPILTVYLEDVLPDQGLKLALVSYQALFKHSYDDEEDFFRKLESATLLEHCKSSAPPAQEPSAGNEGLEPDGSVITAAGIPNASGPETVPVASSPSSKREDGPRVQDDDYPRAFPDDEPIHAAEPKRTPSIPQNDARKTAGGSASDRKPPQAGEPNAQARKGGRFLAVVIALLIVVGVSVAAVAGMSRSASSTTSTNTSERIAAESRSDYDASVAEALSDPDSHRGEVISVCCQLRESSFAEDRFGSGSLMAYVEPYSSSVYIPASELGALVNLAPESYAKLEGTIDAQNGIGYLSNITATETTRIEYLSPTVEAWEVAESASSNNVVFTVDKVEFADLETRVYYTIENGRSSSVSYDSPILQQGSETYQKDGSIGSASSENRLNTMCPGDESVSGIVEYATIEHSDFEVSLVFTSPSEMKGVTLTVAVAAV